MCAALDAIPVQRSHGTDPAFAAAVKMQLHKRDREIAELRAEVRELRAEINTARRLDEISARLDRLEASSRTGLRAV